VFSKRHLHGVEEFDYQKNQQDLVEVINANDPKNKETIETLLVM